MSYELRWRFGRGLAGERIRDALGSFDEAVPNGPDGFCIDRGRDLFVSAELAQEQVVITFAFGGDAEEFGVALAWARHLRSREGGDVFDPQLDVPLDPERPEPAASSWETSNRMALDRYSDGCHSLRQITDLEGKRVMLEAIQEGRPSWINFCTVAVAFTKIGAYEEARRLFDKALGLEPNNTSILYSLGLTYYHQGDKARAAKHLRNALKVEPGNEMARSLLEECVT